MGLFEQFPYPNMHELNLDWIIKFVHHMGHKVDDLEKQLTELQSQVDDIGTNLGELVDKWLREQGAEFVQQIIAEYIQTSVWFGINDAGYWVAYIPASWETINFNTTELDIELPIQPQYGHLVLTY